MDRLKRESGVELLRFLAACAVVLLHYNYYGGALNASCSINHQFLRTLETLSAPAVNIFLLIFGYFQCTKKCIHPGKAVRLIGQVIIFSVGLSFFGGLLRHKLNWQSVMLGFLPNNYFAVLYVTIFFLSPYINSFLQKLSLTDLRRLGIWLFILFSVFPTATDVLQLFVNTSLVGMSTIGAGGSMKGYSILNFFLMYYVGAYLRLSELVKKAPIKHIWFLYLACFLVLNIWDRLEPDTARAYCNPFMIVESACIFLLFARLQFHSKIVNRLATSSFTCFLLHTRFFPIIDASLAATKPLFYLVGHLLLSLVGIYFACWAVDFLYRKATESFFNKLDRILPCYGCQ